MCKNLATRLCAFKLTGSPSRVNVLVAWRGLHDLVHRAASFAAYLPHLTLRCRHALRYTP